MPFPNYHTHSSYCDGIGTPRQIVEQAVALEMPAIGLSSHAPLPFPTEWTMTKENVPEYCAEIRELQAEFKDRIRVLLGLEIDYMPGLIAPNDKKFDPLKLDYRIGAVHFIARFHDGRHWMIDSPRRWEEGFQRIFEGNILRVVSVYYSLVKRMVAGKGFDILAHFDVIKLNNGKGIYFSEDEDWYRRLVRDTLAVVAKSGVIVEVNVGGIVRGKVDAPYPSRWILEICRELRIPVTISADAHKPEMLLDGFADAARMLLDVGYREIMVLGDEGWVARPFTADGVDW